MPRYTYVCSICDEKAVEFRKVSQRNRLRPKCECGNGPMVRDFKADQCMTFNTPYVRECEDDTMGVHPNQVAEHRRLYPNIRMNDGGSILIGSHAERLSTTKKLAEIFRED